MKKILITLAFVLCLASVGVAQDYNTGIGLRAGFDQGLTIKQFISQQSAFEFLLATRWRGFKVTGLYEIHNRAFQTERLNWYFGFGAHIGFWDGNYTKWGDPGVKYTVIGIDGILGLEYNFTEVPINISIDWKPTLNLSGYKGFWGDEGALSIRYIF
jgi:hypothetical protein